MNRISPSPLFLFLCIATTLATAISPSLAADDFIPFDGQGLNIPAEQFKLNLKPRTIDLLGQALQKQTGDNRVSFARDLGQCGPAALKYLLAALTDADPLIRAQAATSIGNIADPSAATSLKPLLSDTDPAVRRQAVLAAAQLNAPDLITAALNDTNEQVLNAAITSATTPAQADQIATHFNQWPPNLQLTAAESLGRLGAHNHLDLILPLLKSNIPARAMALTSIAAMKATDALPQVTTALADEHPTVRRAALAALGQIAPASQQQSSAIRLLQDPDPTVRQAAARVLIASPTPEAIPLLRQQLSTEYIPLHDAARLAIVATGSPAIPLGAELISDPNPRRREDGSFILGQLHSSEKLSDHIKLLDDPDFGVSTQAAKSMYNIVPPAADAGPHLIALIDRAEKAGESDPGFAAFLAAGRIRYAPIIAKALPLLPTPPPNSDGPPPIWRPAAAWAIGMTADSHSSAIARLTAILSDPRQSPGMVTEAAIAMANTHNQDAIPILKDWPTAPPLNHSVTTRWLAHYAYDRLSGTTTPYTPPAPTPHTPELSIEDLTGR